LFRNRPKTGDPLTPVCANTRKIGAFAASSEDCEEKTHRLVPVVRLAESLRTKPLGSVNKLVEVEPQSAQDFVDSEFLGALQSPWRHVIRTRLVLRLMGANPGVHKFVGTNNAFHRRSPERHRQDAIGEVAARPTTNTRTSLNSPLPPLKSIETTRDEFWVHRHASAPTRRASRNPCAFDSPNNSVAARS